jgi:hypothetical protein
MLALSLTHTDTENVVIPSLPTFVQTSSEVIMEDNADNFLPEVTSSSDEDESG